MFVVFAISSSVIGGGAVFVVLFDFGSSPDRGGPLPPRSAEFPCGLSAVSKGSSSCIAISSTVVAFPPRAHAGAVGTVFRRLSGTTRPSDFSQPVADSSFVPCRLPPAEPPRRQRDLSG